MRHMRIISREFRNSLERVRFTLSGYQSLRMNDLQAQVSLKRIEVSVTV